MRPSDCIASLGNDGSLPALSGPVGRCHEIDCVVRLVNKQLISVLAK